MARKKKAAAAEAQPDTSFNPSELERPAADPTEQPVLPHPPIDGGRLPPVEPEGGHAAAVGKRPAIVESGLSFTRNDLIAGVRQGEGFRLVGGRKVREAVIAFAEKPSPDVIALMKDAGFEWKPADKLWTLPIRPDAGWRDRAHAEGTFEAASARIRGERNIGHTAGVAVG